MNVTAIYLANPKRQIEVNFANGIEAVKKVNGGPFAVSGFKSDYGGFVTGWRGGKLGEEEEHDALEP